MTFQFNISHSTKIKCNYNIKYYSVVGKIYNCLIEENHKILTPKSAQIDEVTGTHLNLKNNNLVHAIKVKNNSVFHYFPQGLDKIFPNLYYIRLSFVKLKEIHQTDIKPFSKMIKLDLSSNLINYIEDDLFEFNRKLKFVSLAYNQIYYLHSDVFRNLKSLEYLRLTEIGCMDKSVDNNPNDVFGLINNIDNKCLTFQYKLLNEKFEVLEIATLILNSDAYNAKIEDLEKKIKSSKFSHFKSFQNILQNAKNVKTYVEPANNLVLPVTEETNSTTGNDYF